MAGEIILDQKTKLAQQEATQKEIQELQLRILRAQADKAEAEVDLTKAKTASIMYDYNNKSNPDSNEG